MANIVVTVIPPPSVTISADPATILPGESSTLTWNSAYTDSITIAPDIGIGSAGPDGVVTVSPTQTTTYTITATGLGGTTTADVTVTVTPFNISITSPLEGDSITRPDIMVEGTLANPLGHEVGVVVNGVTAIVYGDQFVANHVALEQGANTITATATDAAGTVVDASIAVYADTTGDYIKITADTESGVSPFETTLRVQASFSFPGFEFSYIGPDTIAFLEPGDDEYRIRMTTKGIYFIMVDADTGAPIEGAVAIAIWLRHSSKERAWWEGGTTVVTRVEEAVSDQQGRIYIDGFWDWHFSKGRYPRLTIYKPEYICWDQKLIYIPGHKADEQRTDFDKKHRIAGLKKRPENFSFIDHRHFVDSVTIRDAHDAPQQKFVTAFEYERKLRIDERKKINEARRKKKQKGDKHD